MPHLDRIPIDHRRTIKTYMPREPTKYQSMIQVPTRSDREIGKLCPSPPPMEVLTMAPFYNGELIVMLHAICVNMTFVPKKHLYVIPH